MGSINEFKQQFFRILAGFDQAVLSRSAFVPSSTDYKLLALQIAITKQLTTHGTTSSVHQLYCERCNDSIVIIFSLFKHNF